MTAALLDRIDESDTSSKVELTFTTEIASDIPKDQINIVARVRCVLHHVNELSKALKKWNIEGILDDLDQNSGDAPMAMCKAMTDLSNDMSIGAILQIADEISNYMP